MYSHYSLQFVDKDIGYVVHEIYVEDMDKLDIPSYIVNDILQLKPNEIVQLNYSKLLQISAIREIAANWPGLIVRIVNFETSIPYRIHGGREFYLMINSKKPLSVSSYVDKKSDLFRFIENYFKPYVKNGTFIEEYIVEASSPEKDVYTKLMYALPNEQWRIKAYKIMYEASKKSGWNDGLEFIEGSLLG